MPRVCRTSAVSMTVHRTVLRTSTFVSLDRECIIPFTEVITDLCKKILYHASVRPPHTARLETHIVSGSDPTIGTLSALSYLLAFGSVVTALFSHP